MILKIIVISLIAISIFICGFTTGRNSMLEELVKHTTEEIKNVKRKNK